MKTFCLCVYLEKMDNCQRCMIKIENAPCYVLSILIFLIDAKGLDTFIMQGALLIMQLVTRRSAS